MTDITPELVAGLLEAATPGPWTQDQHAVREVDGTGYGRLVASAHNARVPVAALIAAAPDIAAAYLASEEACQREHAEVVALREQVRRAKALDSIMRDLRAALAGERASDAPEGEGDDLSDIRTDFIDFPTAWRIQRAGVTHHPECSARATNGAFLCDCGAVTARWEEICAEQSGGAR